jgi:putative phage-type endonuclease
MRLIDVIQRTPAWERWRAGGVTASEAAIVLGRSPYKTPWRLWAERTGVAVPPDLSQNPHVARGVALEDAARQWFEARHDTLLLPVCAESDTHPVLRASFDGIADDGAPVELKAPAEKTFAEVAAEGTASRAYALYWPQLQHQLYVADADHGWLVFFGNVDRVLEFPVDRDDAFLSNELIPACLRFAEQIKKREAPARDPQRDLFVPEGADLARWTQLAASYRALSAECGQLEAPLLALQERLAATQEELVTLMGEFLLAEAAGLKVTRSLQNGAIDYKAALAALLPDVETDVLEAFRRPASERVRTTLRPDLSAP